MGTKTISGQDLVTIDGDLPVAKRAIARAKGENCLVEFTSAGGVHVTVAGDSDPELIAGTIDVQFSSANPGARVVEPHPKTLVFDKSKANLYRPRSSKYTRTTNAVMAYRVRERGWIRCTKVQNDKLVPGGYRYLFVGDWLWQDEVTGAVGYSLQSQFRQTWIV